MNFKTLISSPRLVIQKIRVIGNGFIAFESDFKTGINVIRGDNSSGRTTLLKLFEFGLGANVSPTRFFIPDSPEKRWR